MSWAKRRDALMMISILIWLVFTVTFAIWWFTFSLGHISQLADLQPEHVEHWERQKRMVFWEGTSWVVLLALGGAALVGLVQREKLRSKRIREFFASFSHEIKTSLASLRVQAEALQDDLGQQSSTILNRLVGDTVRLQLQLENSLFLASQDNLQLFVQPLRLSLLIERMREQWPNITIELKGDCTIQGDERALRTIFSNLVQNSLVHGRATRIGVEIKKLANRVEILVGDNGRGFVGSAHKLGELFHRPEATSGSGMGLHISQMLMRKMGGQLSFDPSNKGFRTVLVVEGSPE